MKSKSLLVVVCCFIFCNSNSKKINVNNQYFEIFSVALGESGCIAVKSDTIAYIDGLDSLDNLSCSYTLISNLLDERKKHITAETIKNSIAKNDKIPILRSFSIFIGRIQAPAIAYAFIDSNYCQRVYNLGIDTGSIIVHAFKDKDFIAKRGPSSEMHLVDNQTNKVVQIDFKFGMEFLRDFFLYDLNGDGVPEIFILSDASIYRKERVMVFYIYSAKSASG